MPEPIEIRLTCTGRGAPLAAGRRAVGAWDGSRACPTVDRKRPKLEGRIDDSNRGTSPDKVPPSRPGRSWIASAMLVVFLVAIGLGVLRANVLVGSLFLASATAALVWIAFEARQRKGAV
jgi:hypothetical protein